MSPFKAYIRNLSLLKCIFKTLIPIYIESYNLLHSDAWCSKKGFAPNFCDEVRFPEVIMDMALFSRRTSSFLNEEER